MTARNPGLILAFDFGTRHLGVAVGQSVTGGASALTTLDARRRERLTAALAALVEEWQPAALVVGLPLNMDDSEGALCELARNFAAELAGAFGLPVHLVDERLSSREAAGLLDGGGPKGSRRRSAGPGDHSEAARLIAESYLAEGPAETL